MSLEQDMVKHELHESDRAWDSSPNEATMSFLEIG